MSLEFCEHYPDEFPMMDTFKIIADLMQQIVERNIDMRTIFRQNDPRGQRFLGQQQFVAVLDSLALTQELNDQEVLTLMRRFKADDLYMYEEMCDLISHVYAKNRSESPVGASRKKPLAVVEVNDFDAFKRAARLRTIQWRRYSVGVAST